MCILIQFWGLHWFTSLIFRVHKKVFSLMLALLSTIWCDGNMLSQSINEWKRKGDNGLKMDIMWHFSIQCWWSEHTFKWNLEFRSEFRFSEKINLKLLLSWVNLNRFSSFLFKNNEEVGSLFLERKFRNLKVLRMSLGNECIFSMRLKDTFISKEIREESIEGWRRNCS